MITKSAVKRVVSDVMDIKVSECGNFRVSTSCGVVSIHLKKDNETRSRKLFVMQKGDVCDFANALKEMLK